MTFESDIDPARRCIHVADGIRYIGPTEFRLFGVLYQADLEDGEWLDPSELLARLYAGHRRPRALSTLRHHLAALRSKLAGSRFRIEHQKQSGYRLAVRALTSPPALDVRRPVHKLICQFWVRY